MQIDRQTDKQTPMHVHSSPPLPPGVDVDWGQAGDSHKYSSQLQAHLTLTNYIHFQTGDQTD